MRTADGADWASRTWFRVTHYHKLDCATWVVAMLEYVALAAYGVNGVNLRPFRMLRFLRPVSCPTRTRSHSN
eukprot:1992185-Rhodomonas_salina.2